MPGSVGSVSSNKKRLKSGRRGKKGDKEVLVHSCLPPQVDGQIRCFVVVRLRKVYWTTSKYPDDVFLRCLWWGENVRSAAVFSPAERKVIARYPVRSGPKQMAAYLTDAGALHVDVLRGSDMSTIGKVQVYGLNALAAGKSLSGPYPIFSPSSEIIGHINVDVSMKALTSFEDSGSSSIIPTIDLDNTEYSDKIVGQERIDPRLGTPSAYSSLISHQVDKSLEPPDTPAYSNTSDVKDTEQIRPSNTAEEDLISNLLAKGQRLRSAMISSIADAPPTYTDPLADLDPKLTREPVISALGDEQQYKLETRSRRHHCEQAAVDLVLGSPLKKAVYLSDSMSSTHEEFDLSDFEDPAHDQEILDLLFYKNSAGNSQSKQVDAGTLTDCPPMHGHSTTQPQKEPTEHARPQTSVRERRSSKEDLGNVRPPSRSMSASPRLPASAAPSPTPSLSGHHSDSGASRVSFDMTASDDEDTRSAAEGLSVEQLTLLARVSVARVQIDKMSLKERPSTPVDRKTYKGRPPPSKASKYGTYFVEYQFPVAAASRDENERNATATETVRAVSKKVEKSGVITWNHHTVFPVFFDGQTVEKWWNSMLVLKIHHREQTSRTATLIGSCSVQMKRLLQSLTFGIDLDLRVTKHAKQSAARRKRRRRRAEVIGMMKMNIQLHSDSPSFSTALRELQMNKARKQHPLLRPKPDTPIAAPSKPEYIKPADPVRLGGQGQISQANEQEVHSDLLLHVLLHISEGRQLRTTHQPPSIMDGGGMSTYVVCRLFWCTDKLRSEVCWNAPNPDYMVNEAMPLHLTKDLLNNMANNYMVLEVWQKKTTAQRDQLLGYCKLPLNSFYMSYKEPRIAQVLMKSQYPVIAVDTYMPVTNPLTGKNMGEVKVLLALGTQEQVMSLQTLKVIATVTELEKKQAQSADQQTLKRVEADGQVDIIGHRFEVHVLAVRGLALDDGMYLGEADCFIQYHFPASSSPGELALKAFRSATVLCTDDVTFDDKKSHSINLSGETTLQSSLVAAFGHLHGSSVPFELWCRFYHPNTRDQLMARTALPLAKLLGLVTMARNNEPISSQSYSLPLVPVSDQRKGGSVGVLDIRVQHQKVASKRRQHAASTVLSHGLHNMGTVTLSACIESIAGLKSAALALSHRHQCLDYYSTVGVNLYVKVSLSFQSKCEERVSETEPRTFYLEDFGFKSLFELPLVTDNNNSLAQHLQAGHLVIEVWHQSLKDSLLEDCPGVVPSTDILLGMSSVPLVNLLSLKSGVRGWYPVNPPPEIFTTTQSHDPMLGAVKVQLRFTGSQDISRIADSASKLGYQLPAPGLDLAECVLDEMTEIRFEVDWFTFPDWLIVKSEESLPLGTSCYLRTTFYSNDVMYSKALMLSDKGDHFECRCDVTFKYVQTASTSFLWYLFDQQLEIELWLTTRPSLDKEEVIPTSSDRYLGTAYVPLGELSRRSQCTLSDVYPLYKQTSDRMGRCLVQVHMSRRPHVSHHQMEPSRAGPVHDPLPTQVNDPESSSQSEDDSLDEDTIEAMIKVEEANRLTIGQSADSLLYVSYSLDGREHTTPAVNSSNRPCWLYEKCVRLNLPSIRQAKHMVLKLWCKSEDKGSQVLAFTTIDLRPLLAGMSHLSGWYNIVDFTGLCQGQIKCGIEPLTPLVKMGIPVATPPEIKKSKASATEEVYVTGSTYPEFPSHISRFTEQRVQFGTSSGDSSRASELLSKQLADLDLMTARLRKKLYQPSVQLTSTSSGAHTSSLPPAPSQSSLKDTVQQVQANVQQLMDYGVLTSDQLLPLAAQSTTDATAHQLSSGTGSVSGVRGSNGSPSPFTPRTQASFSLSSDEEESPSTSRVNAEKVMNADEPIHSSDWSTDDLHPLPRGDHSAQTSSASPIRSSSVVSLGSGDSNGVHPGSVELDLAMETGAFHPPAMHSSTCVSVEVMDELVESVEPGLSIKESNSVMKPPDGAQQTSGLPTDILQQAALDSQEECQGQPSDVQLKVLVTEHGEMASEPGVSASGEETTPHSSRPPSPSHSCCSSEDSSYEEEEAISRTLNEDLSVFDDSLDHPFGTLNDSSLHLADSPASIPATGTHGAVAAEVISPVTLADSDEHALPAGDVEPEMLEEIEDEVDVERRLEDKQPAQKQPAVPRPAIPSFFPSKEEMAAKLLTIKQSDPKDRFSKRPPLVHLAREQAISSDRAKRVADIFATRFE